MLTAIACVLLSVPQLTLKPIAKLDYANVIDEMSGIVKSRRFKDTYWVHNDSGDLPRIFAVRKDGRTILPPRYNRKEDAGKDEGKRIYEGITINGASNLDWEDITIDGDTLYIADTGNNFNFRKDLCVYALKEPDPNSSTATHILRRIAVEYPDQTEFPPSGPWNWDCEAVAAYKGKLYFVSKWRVGASGTPGDGAALYVLDKPKSDQVNTLKKLDVTTTLGGWVTGADISPDGKTLAVVVQAPTQSVWLFDMTKGPKVLSRPIGRTVLKNGNQLEAICWDDNNRLIITNEQAQIFEIERPKA
jgi:dipeptidyl aminopeptidase/acylaminoacyl peptidase